MRGAAVQMSAIAAAATCCARMFLLSSTPTRECITSCNPCKPLLRCPPPRACYLCLCRANSRQTIKISIQHSEAASM